MCREKSLFSLCVQASGLWEGQAITPDYPIIAAVRTVAFSLLEKNGNYSLGLKVEKGVLTCKDCGIAAIRHA